ncbi:hypothetical protein [Burkholderia cenocepacia]|uniref:hypothetical protein n=1 Tax=Burkholderia cenocepacia TaxID=95486 RepID=UPI001B97DBBE|nr:hypothetical protein [Burkholderia cenocepacia]MBR7945421.1 hypothetical protein [Burkholderia cenocepacia]
MKGLLKPLGRGHAVGPYVKFDVIEVGDQTVYNLPVPGRLEHYMKPHREVELGVWTLLWAKILIALATDDGKVHRYGTFLLVLHTLAAIVFTPLAFWAAASAGSFVWLGFAFMLLYDVQLLNGWRVVFTVGPINPASSPARGA